MARQKLYTSMRFLALMAFASLSGQALGQRSERLVHEYVPPDAAEAINFGITAGGGRLPAAIRTLSGTITPPDLRTSPEPRRTYHRSAGDDASFRPDRDTRRPKVEHYDDPFTPTLTPFKRMFAFDAVRDDYTLYVRDPTKRRVELEQSARDGDDRFFGDMSLSLHPARHVRIPSVGPSARLLNLVSTPDKALSVWRDGADNWFVLPDGSGGGRVRMVTELAIDRRVFASEYGDPSWGELPRLPAQPAAHQSAYRKVARRIGISRQQTPRQVVAKMVGYFRSFSASSEPIAPQGDIYLDLAMGKLGVCRHRSFGFLVTALNIGIPARLVHNEAHAWVEVRDEHAWRRIDLGGASLNLHEPPDLNRPPHVPPPDHFAWPSGRDSGADLAFRRREEALQQQSERQAPDPTGTSKQAPGVADDQTAGSGGAPDRSEPPPSGPASELTIDEIDLDVFRGLPVTIRGSARMGNRACPNLRIDVGLLIEGLAGVRQVGSLSSGDDGRFAGSVVIPSDVPLGAHELVVATPGGGGCGPGKTR